MCVLSSCTSIRYDGMTEEDKKTFEESISQFRGKYKLHEYDCCNMSYDLTKQLCMKGFDARIYVITGHALVEVVKNGRVYYLDPAKGWAFVSKPTTPISMFTPWQLNDHIQFEFKGHLKTIDKE